MHPVSIQERGPGDLELTFQLPRAFHSLCSFGRVSSFGFSRRQHAFSRGGVLKYFRHCTCVQWQYRTSLDVVASAGLSSASAKGPFIHSAVAFALIAVHVDRFMVAKLCELHDPVLQRELPNVRLRDNEKVQGEVCLLHNLQVLRNLRLQ